MQQSVDRSAQNSRASSVGPEENPPVECFVCEEPQQVARQVVGPRRSPRFSRAPRGSPLAVPAPSSPRARRRGATWAPIGQFPGRSNGSTSVAAFVTHSRCNPTATAPRHCVRLVNAPDTGLPRNSLYTSSYRNVRVWTLNRNIVRVWIQQRENSDPSSMCIGRASNAALATIFYGIAR